jgi:large subunit ribosomal protein L4
LIVLPARDEIITKSVNNIPGVKTLPAHYLNVVDLLTYDHIVVSQSAVAVMASYLSQQGQMVGEDA